MTPPRFVLLDRDGTIIVEKHHLADPEDVELLEGAGAGLRKLSDLGLGLVVVTNQSAIGRGLLDVEGLDEIHRRMTDQLADHGVQLDAIFFCPHHPNDGCACRKPRTAMVERAAAKLRFDATRSFVVGDAPGDIDLGRAIGATTVLVCTGYGAKTDASGTRADHVVADLRDAADVIEEIVSGSSESP